AGPEAWAHASPDVGPRPGGPPADVDLGELARYTAMASTPSHIPVTVDVDDATPLVRGHYDALARALSNILLNAADACAGRDGATIAVHVAPATGTRWDGASSVPVPAAAIRVRDTGPRAPRHHDERTRGIERRRARHQAGRLQFPGEAALARVGPARADHGARPPPGEEGGASPARGAGAHGTVGRD